MGRDLTRRAAEQRDGGGNGNGGNGQPAQQTLHQQIQAMEPQFQLAMPKGAEAGQLVRDAMTCLRATPQLAGCYAPSVLGGLMTCAQLGLRPGVSGLGHAWLIPMWNGKERRTDATLIIGYRGYIELAYRHDKVISVASRVVYSNDHFELSYGIEGDHLVHRPALDGPRGEPRLYYAIARLRGGYALTEPWTQADMDAHRDRYAMAKNKKGELVGPWADKDQAIEMGRKTMIRGPLLKMIPISTELTVAISVDEGVRVDISPTIDPAEVTRTIAGEIETETDQPDAEQGSTGPATEAAADADRSPTSYTAEEIGEMGGQP
jgi:recombination protein RecT